MEKKMEGINYKKHTMTERNTTIGLTLNLFFVNFDRAIKSKRNE